MLDPINLIGNHVYVKGTDAQFIVQKVSYDSSYEDKCYVVLNIGYSPPKEVLEKCISFTVEQQRDHNGCVGEIRYTCTIALSNISDVPFGSPLAQVIYGGN